MVRAINELCDGNPSTETEQLLQRLSRPIHNPDNVVKLFGTNFDADYVNHEILDSIPGNEKVFKSVDEGKCSSKRESRQFVISSSMYKIFKFFYYLFYIFYRVVSLCYRYMVLLLYIKCCNDYLLMVKN